MRDRLYRSRDERVIFGVCGGIADSMDIDPSLVRIVFALLVLAGGFGLGLYIIMAIVVPEEPNYIQMPGAPAAPAAAGVPGAADAKWTAGTDGASMAPGFAESGSGADSGAAAGSGSAAGAGAIPGAAASASWATERTAQREARRAARRAARADRDGRGAAVFGAILVLVGAWFLARRYLPDLDLDFVGPLVLIGLGVLLFVGALIRTSGEEPRQPR